MSNLVSVIIATKNSAKYLREALESVGNSGHQTFEILLVDAASTDDTLSIAERFAADLPETASLEIEAQEGIGLYGAWNQGLAKAKGEYLAFLDSDDYWVPNRLAIGLNYLQENPDTAYQVAHVQFFLEEGCQVPKGFNAELLEQKQLGRIPGTLLARKEVFSRVGNFDQTLQIAGDVDWFARAKDAGLQWAALPEVLLCKRIHDSNLSSYAEKNTKELMEVLHRSMKRQVKES